MAFEHEDDFSHLEIREHTCKDCLNYKDFKDKCWYFWQEKKQCSQKMRMP